jgi:lysophospholipase L1-like esterase
VDSPPGKAPESRASRIFRQVLRRLAFYPFLIASLLVFPAWMPWMIAGWLGVAAARLLLIRKKSAWPVLALCLALVLLKRVAWGPHLQVFLIVLLVATALIAVAPRKPALARWVNPVFGALLATWLFMAVEWHRGAHTSHHPPLQADRPVVLLGDSLSSGGLARVLEKRLTVPVIDLSQGGITTADGVKKIPDLLMARPQAVIIELGGHDSLRGRSRREASENLEQIISASRFLGAEVILFEIPLGFITDSYAGLDRELALRHDLELIGDGAIRQLVYFSPFTPLGRWTGRVLSYDGLHPNDAGNEFLAGRVAAALGRIYGPAVQR